MAQIGTIGVETDTNGTVTIPVFDTGDSGSDVYEMVRVETASGTGFIPVIDPPKAHYPYLRVQTQKHGIVAVHNRAIETQVVASDPDGIASYNSDLDNIEWQASTPATDGDADPDGNIYIVNSNDEDVHKYDQNGNLLWTHTEPVTNIEIAVGPQKNVYLMAGQQLVKLDSSGNEVWRNDKRSSYYRYADIACSTDHLFVAAEKGDFSDHTSALMKFDFDGNFIKDNDRGANAGRSVVAVTGKQNLISTIGGLRKYDSDLNLIYSESLEFPPEPPLYIGQDELILPRGGPVPVYDGTDRNFPVLHTLPTPRDQTDGLDFPIVGRDGIAWIGSNTDDDPGNGDIIKVDYVNNVELARNDDPRAPVTAIPGRIGTFPDEFPSR